MSDLATNDTPPPLTAPAAAEVASLARRLGAEYAREVRFRCEKMKLSFDEADAAARGGDQQDWARQEVDGPVERITWAGLSALAEHDPEATWLAWERVREAARDELASGQRVADALGGNARPLERAQFLAILEAFADEWRPRGGLEAALLEQMALAHSGFLFWTERSNARSTTEVVLEDHTLERDDAWQPPRLEAAEAIEQAATMADRSHRAFLRALRALRDLRRYTPSVVVQNAGQVNVGSQQVNVAQGVGDERSD